MAGLYEEIARADVLVFATPIYWYGPSAQMKAVIDRLRPFAGTDNFRARPASRPAIAGGAGLLRADAGDVRA